VGEGRVGVEFGRVKYDVEEAMKAIRESELPEDFAEYLRTGGRSTPAQSSR
jgi:hypothetical protein